MKHFITGYPDNSDIQVFKQEIPVKLETLKLIMEWEDEGRCVFDHKLTKSQASDIESAGKINLPDDLELYLTCED